MEPKNKDDILKRIVLAAKRLYESDDVRILKQLSENCNFSSYQLSVDEHEKLKNIVDTKGECIIQPIYDAKVKNDWHRLPVSTFLNPQVVL